jgi:hypothetical protein
MESRLTRRLVVESEFVLSFQDVPEDWGGMAVRCARVDGQCSGVLGGLVAHLGDAGTLPLPGRKQRDPKPDRPGADDYRLTLVAHVILQ